MKAEIIDLEDGKTIEMVKETKIWVFFFLKISQINKPLARLRKKRHLNYINS
jgi:hypothetical protein